MVQFIKIKVTKLGSRVLHICPEVTKMRSIIGHRIDYNGVGALRGQRYIPSKNLAKYPLPGGVLSGHLRDLPKCPLVIEVCKICAKFVND